MSAENKVGAGEAEAGAMCCASCGTPESDEIKLKMCTACKSARYCGVECQKNHRPHHKKACKKRAAELRDELLFRQPESSHLGDCPICFLPLPISVNKNEFSIFSCCSKSICDGCMLISTKRSEQSKQRCPFCRRLVDLPDEELEKMRMERAEANDPEVLREIGIKRYNEGDCNTAITHFKKAADLGDAVAHYNLSFAYAEGEGVEKDEKRGRYHLEEAAIAGHPLARYNLGIDEEERGRSDRAAKHWIIAAVLGHDESIKAVKDCYKKGHVSKDDLDAALRAHQAAVDATKSPQRDAAAAVWR